MKLTAIRGIEPEVLRDALAALLESQGLDGRVTVVRRSVVLQDVRLRERAYNYLAYYNERHSNWYATIDAKSGRPVCKNAWMPDLEHRPRRAKYLQWRHWAWLDNAVNELLDELGVSCTFRSTYGVLRLGAIWDAICPMQYTLTDNEGKVV